MNTEAIKKSFGDIAEGYIRISYHQTKTPEEELPNHLHDWHELIFVHKGMGSFLIDSQLLQVSVGDVFIIPSNIVHRGMPEKDHLITSTVLYLHPHAFSMYSEYESLIIKSAKQSNVYKYHLSNQTELNELLSRLRSESDGVDQGHKQAIAAITQLVLVHLSRHAVGDEDRKKANRFNNLLVYIDKHLGDDLPLADLAAKENLSAAHLSRLFKREVGMNVSDYVLTKRISHAKTRLVETDDTVAVIAEKCGFFSLPHFYRSFKRLTNVTPNRYRRQTEELNFSK